MTHSQPTHLESSGEPTLANLWPIAVPLAGAMLSQALIGLVDTALVGHLGGLALASVSIGSYLVFILVAIIKFIDRKESIENHEFHRKWIHTNN